MKLSGHSGITVHQLLKPSVQGMGRCDRKKKIWIKLLKAKNQNTESQKKSVYLCSTEGKKYFTDYMFIYMLCTLQKKAIAQLIHLLVIQYDT